MKLSRDGLGEPAYGSTSSPPADSRRPCSRHGSGRGGGVPAEYGVNDSLLRRVGEEDGGDVPWPGESAFVATFAEVPVQGAEGGGTWMPRSAMRLIRDWVLGRGLSAALAAAHSSQTFSARGRRRTTARGTANFRSRASMRFLMRLNDIGVYLSGFFESGSGGGWEWGRLFDFLNLGCGAPMWGGFETGPYGLFPRLSHVRVFRLLPIGRRSCGGGGDGGRGGTEISVFAAISGHFRTWVNWRLRWTVSGRCAPAHGNWCEGRSCDWWTWGTFLSARWISGRCRRSNCRKQTFYTTIIDCTDGLPGIGVGAM